MGVLVSKNSKGDVRMLIKPCPTSDNTKAVVGKKARVKDVLVHVVLRHVIALHQHSFTLRYGWNMQGYAAVQVL
jgi:hypothetical protein